MRFMVENVSAGPNINRARRFLVECPEAGTRLLLILKNAIVRHLVEQIAAGAQVSCCCCVPQLTTLGVTWYMQLGTDKNIL